MFDILWTILLGIKKVDEYPLQMNLDELIKILERHHQALQVNHLVYPALLSRKRIYGSANTIDRT